MKLKKFLSIALLSLTSSFFVSCSKDNTNTPLDKVGTALDVNRVEGRYDATLLSPAMKGAPVATKMMIELKKGDNNEYSFVFGDFPGMGPKNMVQGLKISNLKAEQKADANFVLFAEKALVKALKMGKMTFDSELAAQGTLINGNLDLTISWGIIMGGNKAHTFKLSLKGKKVK